MPYQNHSVTKCSKKYNRFFAEIISVQSNTYKQQGMSIGKPAYSYYLSYYISTNLKKKEKQTIKQKTRKKFFK